MSGNTGPHAPVVSSMTDDLTLTQVHLPCHSNVHAVQFRDRLLRRGVVVDEVLDNEVVVAYSGNLRFVQDIATVAVMGNYADGTTMAAVLAVEEARINGVLDTPVVPA